MTRPALLSAVASLLLCGLTSACGVVVVGTPSAGGRAPADAPPGEVTVVGATEEPVDELARNALADLQDFWSDQFPDVFGGAFQPLQGGYFSVDPDDVDPRDYPQGVGCGSDPREAAKNAFYCQAPDEPASDSITYDRAFLAELADGYGRFLPALVMAHEFGHAVQGRVGSPGPSIATETQADCFAGAWSAWVVDGRAEHSQLREGELDDLLRGYFLLRDPVGTSPAEQSAHGSYFDRVSAFQEGFDDGPEACRDRFGPDRVFTQGEFRDRELGNQGNAPYGELVALIDEALPAFWDRAFTDVFDADFDAPPIEPFTGSAPDCAPSDRDLVYCADGNVVGYDEELTTTAYELGDYAVATALAIPYALGARDQLGLDPADPDAIRSAVCLTGWFSAQVFNRGVPDVLISPGDLDESVLFLLEYGVSEDVLGSANLSGFQLVDVFRGGFVEGVEACDVGA
ncbi:neutral zinc metallopeptidase [Blastococcus atacamensis]|uniref:neutral zinc metallopeptidase n=1 Tax=Blastococcus atacamensis TaxID=2070508 RepID=UPI000CEBAC03|nr:neutral zinc metallopeptidase [Blastococcus atacamensis]